MTGNPVTSYIHESENLAQRILFFIFSLETYVTSTEGDIRSFSDVELYVSFASKLLVNY